ncbi:MAG TPA: cytochrome c oxidase assembly protein [bacterium]|nr:cytochrome c oxidase assembly protein [bacterium]
MMPGIVTLRWTDWFWDPMTMAALALTAVSYLWILQRFPRQAAHAGSFWAGFLVLVIALLSPIHTGAAYLFWLHMVQHMLLMIVVPPLIVLGMPTGALGWVYRRRGLRRLHRFVWSPGVATILYNGVFLLWHVPAMYDATLWSVWIHTIEHASFVAVGLVFWGVVAFPGARRPALGWRFVMLMASNVVDFLVGLTFAFSNRPFYLPYTHVPRLWGFTPLADQRLGGLVMWVGGQMMYTVPMLALLYWWILRDPGGSISSGPVPLGIAAGGGDGWSRRETGARS